MPANAVDGVFIQSKQARTEESKKIGLPLQQTEMHADAVMLCWALGSSIVSGKTTCEQCCEL